MRINKRKALLGIVCALFIVALVLVVANLLQLRRTGRRLQALQSQRSEVSERLAQLATRLEAAPRPAFSSAATSATVAPPPVSTPAPLSHSELVRELAAITQDFFSLEDAFSRIHDPALNEALFRGRGIDGIGLYLPASDFPEEGRSGAFYGGARLRERIRKEVLRLNVFAPPPVAHPRITSATLAARTRALVDRTANTLHHSWDAADPTSLGMTMVYGTPGFSNFAPLAVECAARAGRAEEARRMLESLLRKMLLLRLGGSPSPTPWHSLQSTVFYMAGQGWLDDATLARLDRLLAQAHLSAAQLADLRAAWTLQIINMFEAGLKQGIAPQQGGDEWQRNLRSASLQGARMLLENTLYAAMLAWAAGDGSAYDHALKGPLAFTFILPKVQDAGFCPPAMSTFDGGESAGNDDLDLLRLLVAAARYRLAQGRDPARIEDLIPRYLDAAFNAPGPSFRAIDAVRNEAAATTSSAALVAVRPIFYVARRMTLTPLRARVSYDAGFGRRDLTGLNEPTRVGGWLRYLDSSLGQALDLMSSRSVEVIAIRIIWPRTEDVDLGWLDGPGNSEINVVNPYN